MDKYELRWREERCDWDREVKPAFSRVCDGRNAALWIDDTDSGVGRPTQYLVIYPSVDYSSSSKKQASSKFVELRCGFPTTRADRITSMRPVPSQEHWR